MRKHTVITEDIEDVDCELTFEPVEYCDSHKARVGDMLVYGYLVYDNDYNRLDDLMGDCMGKMYSFHRDAGRDDHSNGLEALGNNSDGEMDLEAVYSNHIRVAEQRYLDKVSAALDFADVLEDMRGLYDQAEDETDSDFVTESLRRDIDYHNWDCVHYYELMQKVLEEMWNEPKFFPGDPDAQPLSCYSHSGEHWSLNGHGMQCRWDTSNSAGVWVPDKCLKEELTQLTPDARKAKAQLYCQQFLDMYNEINSGQVFGVVVEWFDDSGTSIDNDSCWGYVGSDHAEETLKETFDSTVEYLQKKYDEDVRTQCGAQAEMELA